jgi:hypothetical protein
MEKMELLMTVKSLWFVKDCYYYSMAIAKLFRWWVYYLLKVRPWVYD